MNDLKDYEKKRIYLVKHSLYKTYTENRRDKISIESIMNIILLLFQDPVALALYRKEEKDTYRVIYHTIRDQRLSDCFDGHLSKYNMGSHNAKYLKKKNIKNHLHIIPYMGYGIMIFNIERSHKCNKNIKFTIANQSNEKETNSILFRCLWSALIETPYASKLGLKSHIKKVFDGINNKGKPIYDRRPITIYDGKKVERKFKDKCSKSIKEIIDIVYKSIYRTPLLSTQDKFPPNVFFFIRSYDNDDIKRFGSYDYNISMVICETQKKHIKETLKLIRDNKFTDGKTWSFPLTKFKESNLRVRHDPSVRDYEENDEYPNSIIRDKFWKLLKKAEGIRTIISALETPFGKNAMSLVDPVMSSGLLYIRRSPFMDGGIDRISMKTGDPFHIDKDFDLETPENIDILRLVSVYYLMASAAPESKKETLRVLVMPTRVSGSTLFSMSTATTNERKVSLRKYEKDIYTNEYRLEQEEIDFLNKKEIRSDVKLAGINKVRNDKERTALISRKDDLLIQNDSTWDYFYHFATGIGSKVTRKIRKEIKSKYVNLVSDIFSDRLKENIVPTEDSNFKFNNFIENVNHDLISLSRVYPYDLIQIHHSERDRTKMSGIDRNFAIGESAIIGFTIFENQFFDRTVDRMFLSKDSVCKIIEKSVSDALYALSD